MKSLSESHNNTLAIQILIVAALIGILYAPVFPSLWKAWNQDPNYGHGVFVPFLTAFLFWWKRNAIKEIKPNPYGPGLFVVFLGIMLYLIGIVGNELFTMRASMIVVIFGVLMSLLGLRGAKFLSFPVFYLLLMIPLPYIIYYAVASPMKLFATKWAVFFVDLLRISVHNEGNIIYLSNTTLEVADACSGLRSLMSLFTFGLVFAYVAQQTFLYRSVLVTAIIPIAIISNIIRIIITAMLSYYKGPETAHGFLHDTSGIVVYTVATVLTFGVNEVLRKINKQSSKKQSSKKVQTPQSI
jgi:exosortase